MIDTIQTFINTASLPELFFMAFWSALFVISPVLWWIEVRALKKSGYFD